MLQDDFFDERKAKPRAIFARALGVFCPIKAVENPLKVVLVHSIALVVDFDQNMIAVVTGADGNLSMSGRILYSIRDQIIASIFEKFSIASCPIQDEPEGRGDSNTR